MTKYTTRELLKNLIGFVIRKDILIDLLSTHPDLLNHPPFSAGPPSSAENIAWANTGLDITLGKASARISEALERMENVVAHAAQYNLHIQPRTPYSLAIELVLQVNLESSFDVTEYGRPAFAKAIEAVLADAAFGFNADQLTQSEREQVRKYANALFDSAASIRAQVTAAYMGITRSQDDQYRNLAWRAPTPSEHNSGADMSSILGHQNYVNVPEFSSVHSPAAYLADLEKCRLQYVSTKVVDAEGSYDPFGKSFDFETRRADILSLELNEENTTVLVPKLDIAIDVLETQIAAQQGIDKGRVSQAISQEIYPLDLPFNLNLAKCDALAGMLSTSMREIWQALAPDLAHIGSADDQRYAVIRETLGLSKLDVDWLAAPGSAHLNARRYGLDPEHHESITQITVFKDATGLTSTEIDALFYPFIEHPTPEDLASNPGFSVLSRTYLNAFETVNGNIDAGSDVSYPPLQISPHDPEKIIPFTLERQARASKLIRLSRKLGLSFEDVYRMLSYTAKVRQLAIDVDVLSHQYLPTTLSFMAGLLDAQKALSRNSTSTVSISETIATVGVLSDSPERDGVSQLEAVFGSELSLGIAWPKASENPETHQRIAGLIRSALGLNQTEYDAIEAVIETRLVSPAPRILHLTHVSIFYRLAMIAQANDLTADALIALLDGIGASFIGHIVTVPATTTNGETQSYLGDFMDSHNLPMGTAFIDTVLNASEAVDKITGAGFSIAETVDFSAPDAQSMAAYRQSEASISEIYIALSSALSNVLLSRSEYESWLNTVSSADKQALDDDNYDYSYQGLIDGGHIDAFGIVLRPGMSGADDDAQTGGAPSGAGSLITTAGSWITTTSPAAIAAFETFNAHFADILAQQAAVTRGALITQTALPEVIESALMDWAELLEGSTTPNAYTEIFFSEIKAGAPLDRARSALAQIKRLAEICDRLALSEDEVEYVTASGLGILAPADTEPFAIRPSSLLELIDMHQLFVRLGNEDGALISYLETEILEDVTPTSAWSLDDINKIRAYWTPSAGRLEKLRFVESAAVLFDISARSGLSLDEIMAVGRVEADGTHNNFANAVQILTAAVYSAHPSTARETLDDAWKLEVLGDYRDALSHMLIVLYARSDEPRLKAISTVDQLSEYHLIDLKTGPQVKTSRIKEAIGASQTYLRRIMMNLEPELTIDKAFRNNYWQWFENYRVWQANRKVLIEPEPYLQPDLVTDASPLYDTFIGDINPSSISSDSVETAFGNLVHSLEELGQITIVSGNIIETQNEARTLLVIGRTRSQPTKFYARTAQMVFDGQTQSHSVESWQHWTDLALPSETEFVRSTAAFGKFFVFWTDFSASGGDDENAKAILKYIYSRSNGEWSIPQTLDTIDLGATSLSVAQLKESPRFNKLTVDTQSSATSSGAQGLKEQIKVVYALYDEALHAENSFEYSIDATYSSKLEDKTLEYRSAGVAASETPDTISIAGKIASPQTIANNADPNSGWYGTNYINRDRVGKRIKASNFKRTDSTLTGPLSGTDIYSFEHRKGHALQAKLSDLSYPAVDDQSALSAGAWFYVEKMRGGHHSPLMTYGSESNLKVDISDGSIRLMIGDDESRVLQIDNEAIATQQWMFVAFSFDAPNADGAREYALSVSTMGENDLITPLAWQVQGNFQGHENAEFVTYAAGCLVGHVSEFRLSCTGASVIEGYYLDDTDSADDNLATLSQKATQLPAETDSPAIGVISSSSIGTILVDKNTPIETAFLYDHPEKPGPNDAAKKPVSQVSFPSHARIDGQRSFYLSEEFGHSLQVDSAGLNISAEGALTISTWFRVDAFDDEGKPVNILRLTLQNSWNDLLINADEYGRVFAKFAGGRNSNIDLSTNVGTVENRWLFVAVTISKDSFRLFVGEDRRGNSMVETLYSQSADVDPVDFAMFDSEPGFVFGRNFADFAPNDSSAAHFEDIRVANAYFETDEQLLTWADLELMYQADVDLPFSNLSDLLNVRSVNSNAVEETAHYVVNFTSGSYLALPIGDGQTRFVRLVSATAAANLSHAHSRGGTSELLSVDTQLGSEVAFTDLEPDATRAPIEYWPSDKVLGLEGPDGEYYRELYFYAPWLVAKTFSQGGQYDLAQGWYRKIFDPLHDALDQGVRETASQAYSLSENDKYWRYLGLRPDYNRTLALAGAGESRTSLLQRMIDQPIAFADSADGSAFQQVDRSAMQFVDNVSLAAYYQNPFEPHAIARLHHVTYQKAIAYAYIQNLTAWADSLYEQRSRESIVEALMLYLEANNLLGLHPSENMEFVPSATTTLGGLHTLYKVHSVEDADLADDHRIPEFLLGLEADLGRIESPISPVDAGKVPYNFVPGLYFGIPQTETIASLWTTLEHRLTAIRNNLDIDGNPLDAALFEPAIDVMSLVKAAARGSLKAALGNVLKRDMPHYRFDAMLSRAGELNSLAGAFGQQLLSALERKDGDELRRLQLTQSQELLNMTLEIQETQLKQAATELDMVRNEMKSALMRYVFTDALLAQTNSSRARRSQNSIKLGQVNDNAGVGAVNEVTDISVNIDVSDTETGMTFEFLGLSAAAATPLLLLRAGIARTMADIAAVGAVKGPTADVQDPTGGIRASASAYDALAWSINFGGEFFQELGRKFKARDELKQQRRLAKQDIKRLEMQWKNVQYQHQIAQTDLEATRLNISHTRAIDDLYSSQFTGNGLYTWMAGELQTLFQQSYKLAVKSALAAQRALEFEFGLPDNSIDIVDTSGWQADRKGLLSTERLAMSLQRLIDYQMSHNERRLEVSKTVSLRDLMGEEFDLQLASGTGLLTFDLPQELFDQDFPNHYCRQIQMVSVSVPAVLAPYADLHATLTQTANHTMLEPGGDALKAIYQHVTSEDVANTTPTPPTKIDNLALISDGGILRSNVNIDQEVVLSSAAGDDGQSVLTADEGRYRPFEGTGVVSRWALYLSDLDTSIARKQPRDIAVSDIIVNVQYCARSVSPTDAYTSDTKQALRTVFPAA